MNSDGEKKLKFAGMPPRTTEPEDLTYRKIPKYVLIACGVRDLPLLDSDDDDCSSGLLLFPMHDRKGKVIGVKYRDFWKQYEDGYNKNKCITVKGSLTLGGTKTCSGKRDVCVWKVKLTG